jgi:hypothetical protein
MSVLRRRTAVFALSLTALVAAVPAASAASTPNPSSVRPGPIMVPAPCTLNRCWAPPIRNIA